MKKELYKVAIIQAVIFLAYDLILSLEGGQIFLLPVIIIHALSLLFFSIYFFRKKETYKAFGFLLPFFMVLLIGIGSCGGIFAIGAANNMENIKFAYEKHHPKIKANESESEKPPLHQQDDVKKPKREKGMPGRRYKWWKRNKKDKQQD